MQLFAAIYKKVSADSEEIVRQDFIYNMWYIYVSVVFIIIIIGHIENCMKQNVCAIKVPTKENNIIRFKDYKRKIMMPFIIYADIELILHPVVNSTFSKTDRTKAFSTIPNQKWKKILKVKLYKRFLSSRANVHLPSLHSHSLKYLRLRWIMTVEWPSI